MWPALSRTYGIRPIDCDLYSVAELNAYLDDLRAEADAARRAEAEAQRRR